MIAADLSAAFLGLAGLLGAGLAWGGGVVAQGWLAAAVTVIGLPLGCLLLLMVDHLLPEPWSWRVNPALEAAALTLPLLALAFVPVLVQLDSLYPWGGPPDPWPVHWPRNAWLTPEIFAMRSVLILVLLSALAVLSANRTRGERHPALAALGLICLTLLATAANVDWVMSLEPPYHSTIFGLELLAAQVLSGLALAALAGLLPAPSSPAAPRVAGLGATLVSLVLLWAYLSFMQYLVVWSGNLPDEVAWYLRRSSGGWATVVWAVWLLAAASFLILMVGAWRRSRTGVIAAAAVILLMRGIESLWWVAPAWRDDGGRSGLAILAGVAAVGGLWLAAFLALLRRRARGQVPAHG